MASRRVGTIAVFVIAATGCNVNRALEQLSEARGLSSDLLVQFVKASDAANRAVMADTDAASTEFAREAEQAKQGVQKDIDALGPVLDSLKFADERRLLQQFVGRFAEYTALDRHILDLAVENTNLKAQRLSFGPAQEAAYAFSDALQALTPAARPSDTRLRHETRWRHSPRSFRQRPGRGSPPRLPPSTGSWPSTPRSSPCPAATPTCVRWRCR